jgi:hypothetical protein
MLQSGRPYPLAQSAAHRQTGYLDSMWSAGGRRRTFGQTPARMWSVDEGMMLLLVGAVLSASLVVALGATRTGLPALVAFLGLGMLLGSDGPGGVGFDDENLAREVGIVGLGLILFEGGLQTSWRRLREVAVPAALLSTVGVVVSTVLTGEARQLWLLRSRSARRSADRPRPSRRRCLGRRSVLGVRPSASLDRSVRACRVDRRGCPFLRSR